ncbi:MAG: response regulator [Candidatus Binatia bacterium]
MVPTRPTILVIDDCTDIARIISRFLEGAFFRTQIANGGIAGREMMSASKPDAIVLDLMMPGMGGAEFLHALRRDPDTADIPVVLVSARVGHHGTHFRSEVGADFVVGKPFTRQQIVGAVRTVLAVKAGVAPEALPLRIDAKSRLAHQLGLIR